MTSNTFGASVASARAAGHDVRRRLFLSDDVSLVLVKGSRGEATLGELTEGWYLDLKERIEPETGARYYSLFIDDVKGDRLQMLKDMTGVRLNGIFYKPLAKPLFEGTIPGYRFKVQAMGPQI